MSQAKLKVVNNENSMDKENRSKSLEAAVSLIEKNYGKGSIMKLGSKTNVDIEAISTGSLGLDIALGTSAATESIISTSIPPDLISESAISKPCSPVSGCDINNSSKFTPNFFAYAGSKACSASINAQLPPCFCDSATIWVAKVVLPEL